jgi:hypothetical protein
MALGCEIACSASHAKPTLTDESLKLDRQWGFGYSSILDRGVCSSYARNTQLIDM